MGNGDDRRQGGIDDAAEDGGLGETALSARVKRGKRASRCLCCVCGGGAAETDAARGFQPRVRADIAQPESQIDHHPYRYLILAC